MDAAPAITEKPPLTDLSGAPIDPPPEKLSHWCGREIKMMFQNQTMEEAAEIGTYSFDRIWKLSGFVRTYIEDMPMESKDEKVGILELLGPPDEVTPDLVRATFDLLAKRYYAEEFTAKAESVYETFKAETRQLLMRWLDICHPQLEVHYLDYNLKQLPVDLRDWDSDEYRRLADIAGALVEAHMQTAKEALADRFFPKIVCYDSYLRTWDVSFRLLRCLERMGLMEDACKRHKIVELVQQAVQTWTPEFGLAVLQSAITLTEDDQLRSLHAQLTARHPDQAKDRDRTIAIAYFQDLIAQNKADHEVHQALALLLQSHSDPSLNNWDTALVHYKQALELCPEESWKPYYQAIIQWTQNMIEGYRLDEEAPSDGAAAVIETDSIPSVTELRDHFQALTLRTAPILQPPRIPSTWPASTKALRFAGHVLARLRQGDILAQ